MFYDYKIERRTLICPHCEREHIAVIKSEIPRDGRVHKVYKLQENEFNLKSGTKTIICFCGKEFPV